MNEEVGFSSEGGEKSIEFKDGYWGYWVKAQCDAPWITIVKCEEGLLIVKVGANSGDERKAVVNILLSDGELLGTVTVTQQ